MIIVAKLSTAELQWLEEQGERSFYKIIFFIIGVPILGGIIQMVFSSVFSFKSSSSFDYKGEKQIEEDTKDEKQKIDTNKRHESDYHEYMLRSCADCKYYESGYGSCKFDRSGNVHASEARNYTCDNFMSK